MKRTRNGVITGAASRLVSIFSLVALVLTLSGNVSAQRPDRAAENPKVRLGEYPPDFDLPRLTFETDTTGKTVGVISEDNTIRLSSYRGKKPVCMIMSSYT